MSFRILPYAEKCFLTFFSSLSLSLSISYFILFFLYRTNFSHTSGGRDCSRLYKSDGTIGDRIVGDDRNGWIVGGASPVIRAVGRVQGEANQAGEGRRPMGVSDWDLCTGESPVRAPTDVSVCSSPVGLRSCLGDLG